MLLGHERTEAESLNVARSTLVLSIDKIPETTVSNQPHKVLHIKDEV